MERFNKVAQITLLFWVMKIIATTLGETLGDFFSMTLNLGYLITLLTMSIFFMLVLGIQLSVKQYMPFFYWLVIVGTTTMGTEISDYIDRSLHFGYAVGSLLLFICLVITLLLWKKRFNNLEIFPIKDKGKEIYYWVAILFSNSLGTAFGDFLSDNIGLSYLSGALLTGAIIIAVVALHYFTKINHIVLFWIAFVFTRPFGATFGDFVTKPLSKGGMNLGTLQASIVCAIIMGLFIIISQRHQAKVEKINP